MPYTLICNEMDQTQIQNKNKNNERSRGRMLELITKARSKDRAVPLERALIGGVQPIWLVGPRRPRYKEREGCRGSHYEVRHHKPLSQKPYPI